MPGADRSGRAICVRRGGRCHGDDEAAVVELEAAIRVRAVFGVRFAGAQFLRARSLDRIGRRNPAIDAYRAFLTQAGDADPTLATEAAIAREGIAELSVRR